MKYTISLACLPKALVSVYNFWHLYPLECKRNRLILRWENLGIFSQSFSKLKNIAIEQSFVAVYRERSQWLLWCHTWFCRYIIVEENGSKLIYVAYYQVAQKTDILKEVSFWVISSYTGVKTSACDVCLGDVSTGRLIFGDNFGLEMCTCKLILSPEGALRKLHLHEWRSG
jgi:hypothetical protein